MKSLINQAFFGKDRFSGLIALAVVALVALGCTCNKDFGSTSNSNSNTTYSTPAPNTGTNPDSKPTKTTSSSGSADASTGKVPTDPQLQDLARETMMDFNSAVRDGSFVEFHSNVSKPFQKQVSVGKFEEVFKDFIAAKPDFSEIRDLDAEFSPTPSIGSEGGYKTLNVNGVYKTSPRNTKIELKYIPEGKDWKLIFIRVNTKD